jgi:hypothetical protein
MISVGPPMTEKTISQHSLLAVAVMSSPWDDPRRGAGWGF